ncbi:hypothetical protein D9758_009234 [Tetrapyrgos nigripes]|uniref:Peptidase S53 domain-containing protein n=1 Tax=Tetrapyrgos nigripes TaxID=182062 RepID=A0A8H5FWV4_9AGAR|nr:hypothetical protein D9758_009234 [Tetrapyrgos nigripes]
MMRTSLALASLLCSIFLSTAARSEGLGWHFVQTGSTQLTAAQAMVVSPSLVVIFDRVLGDPLQINGHQAWGAVWNTDANNVTAIDLVTDTFCASGGFLSNGTMVSVGGNPVEVEDGQVDPAPDKDGLVGLRIWEPCGHPAGLNCTLFENPDTHSLAEKRWYPTSLRIFDGSLMIIGGIKENTTFFNDKERSASSFEFFPQKDGGVPRPSEFLDRSLPANLFPRSFALPDGKIFMVANNQTITYDIEEQTETILPDIPNGVRVTNPYDGTATLLPLSPPDYIPEVLVCGGTNTTDQLTNDDVYTLSSQDPASDQCSRIVLTPEGIKKGWEVDFMPEARVMPEMILMPNGKVLIINGGGTGYAAVKQVRDPVGQSNADHPVLTPVLYDYSAPLGSRFDREGLPTTDIARMYHSSVSLLPGGNIFIAGSNPGNGVHFNDKFPSEFRVEYLNPPYMTVARPSMSNVPEKVAYNDKFTVDIEIPEGLNTSIQVSLMDLGFSSHAFHSSSRLVFLEFTLSEDKKTLKMTAPPNNRVYPPGPAWLYITVDDVTSNGAQIMNVAVWLPGTMVHLLTFAALAFAAFASVTATPARRAMAVAEQRQVPVSFARAGKPDAETKLDLRIALRQKDMEALEKALYDVSTPDSSLYGQHLSLEEVTTYATPSEESVNTVTQWLQGNGVTDITLSGPFDDWISFRVSVSKADELLDTNFENFVHIESGERLVRTLQYSIPQDLLPHIDLVHPTTAFVRPLAKQPVMSVPIPGSANLTERALGAPDDCNGLVTPACLQSLYGIPATPATQSSNMIGVSGFVNQFAQNEDLRNFLGSLRPDMSPDTTFTVQSIDGGVNTQGPGLAGLEANLDVQYTLGLATDVPTVFITVGNQSSDGAGGFLDLIDTLNAESAPPQVLTTSYSFDEGDLGSALDNRICNAYMTLGARGVSLLFSSGDGGVSGGQPQSCTSFIPTFPGGCPFITSVGGTQGVDEIAADFSTGGFSGVFSRPSYQDDTVSAYLSALGSTDSGLFNASGRGFPDVAAQGVNIEIKSGSRTARVAGTSASSPIFASVIALINDRLVAAGKPVLGFLNPFLYANPQAFFDIASGSNPGCGTDGFPASSGWDPVTGLGTPNFAVLLTAAGL